MDIDVIIDYGEPLKEVHTLTFNKYTPIPITIENILYKLRKKLSIIKQQRVRRLFFDLFCYKYPTGIYVPNSLWVH